MENIKQGSVIKGFKWPEPVEIKLMEEIGEYVHIVGATTISRNHIDQLMSHEEFSKLYIEEVGPTFAEEPWKVFFSAGDSSLSLCLHV
jgi:hypothetical protein